jgi:DNA-binding NarL/FixJ family response regulator
MISIVLADDHHLVRQGIKALLEKIANLTVIGEAENGRQALELVQQLDPDILLVDIAMPAPNGIDVARQLQGQETRVIILSMNADDMLVRQALMAGVSGYLLKRSVAGDLNEAIQAALQGQIYLSPPLRTQELEQELPQLIAGDTKQTGFSSLTPREMEIFRLIVESHTNVVIAQNLNISVKTVEKHRASLMEKLDTRDLAGLIRVAIKHGVIFLDE